jgi:hypothetical protein
MKPTLVLPHDPELPGLMAIRTRGLKAALPTLKLKGHVDLLLRGYSEGKRATMEACCGELRFAVKACDKDSAPEAQLYRELGACGLAPAVANGSYGVRVPHFLAYNPDLHLLATGWLEGPTVSELIKDGQGERAGELASRWFRRTSSLPVILGPTYDSAHVLEKIAGWIADLALADPMLGSAALSLARELSATPPPPGSPGLLHGTLYARHIIDAGAAGLIDWDAFGHGPLEFDAGVFLATVWRIRLSHPECASAVARAEQAFLAGTAGRLAGGALAWYRAAALMDIAHRLDNRGKQNWKARAMALLSEAGRLAVTAAA